MSNGSEPEFECKCIVVIQKIYGGPIIGYWAIPNPRITAHSLAVVVDIWSIENCISNSDGGAILRNLSGIVVSNTKNSGLFLQPRKDPFSKLGISHSIDFIKSFHQLYLIISGLSIRDCLTHDLLNSRTVHPCL